MMSVSAFIPMYEEVKWERTTESRMSTVISLLPTSLKSRMPPFRPFRRTASMENLTRTEGSDGEQLVASPRQRIRPLSVAGPGGLSCDELTTASASGIHGRDGRIVQTEHAASTAATMKATEPGGAMTGGQTATVTGINWRFATQGSSLIQGASEAARENINDAFERKAFIDGLTYLIRALPQDLDERELEQVKAALPAALALHSTAIGPQGRPSHTTSGLPRSRLHRSVQVIVVQLILFLHFILPYLVLFLRTVVTVERKFKVSEAVLGHSISLANAFGRQCTHLADIVVKVNDGKVGQGLSSAVAWTVEEVTRGISDGVGEGMIVTRLWDSPSPSPSL